MKTVLFAAVLAGISLGGAQSQPVTDSAYRAIVQEAKAHVQEVEVQRFQALRKAHPDPVFIDVRESEEWGSGHAAGALHISKGMLEHDVEAKVANKQAIVVLAIQRHIHELARSGDFDQGKKLLNSEDTPLWRRYKQTMLDFRQSLDQAAARVSGEIQQHSRSAQILAWLAGVLLIAASLMALIKAGQVARRLQQLADTLR